MYQHILLAIDGSGNALRAAEETLKITSEQTFIDVVYVADVNKAQQDLLQNGTNDAIYLARKRKIAPVEQLLKRANRRFKITVLHGVPSTELIRYANENNNELVVIGSRGLNTLQEMILGSVSHKVLKRVSCPVLVVK